MRILHFFFLLLFSNAINAQKANTFIKPNSDDNTLLWQISGNGLTKPSYLFGTFHLLCKDDIHFSTACREAIANSNKIYLELDIDDPATILSDFTLMNMKEGKKLEDLFTADEYKKVSTYFKDSLKTALGLFKNMKPYFLMALLYPKMMPCKAVSGVDEAIASLAKKNNKEIKGLETMAFQASLFDSIPYAKQAEELLQAIDSIDKSKKYFALLNKAYLQQNMKLIETMLNDPEFGMEENQGILLDNRNMDWIGQLKIIMKNEPVFVAVGTGHLIGDKGLITLLRAGGYTVKAIGNK